VKIIKPIVPAISPNMYRDRLKKAQITVKNKKMGRLERAREELTKAKSVIINPTMARGTILFRGSGRSMIMVATRVVNMTALTPLSKPRYLAKKAAKIIKTMDLAACFHRGLPLGLDNIFNLPEKPFFFMHLSSHI
jgi:hypothetical protein